MKRIHNKKGAKGTFVYALKIFILLCASLLICLTTYGVYLTKKAETAANQAYEEIEESSNF